MSKVQYNAMKLSEYRPMFHDKKVLVIGVGAVGSYLMEFFARMGVSPDAMDFDYLTLENAAKHSCLIRTPEDAGRNKAECTSERVIPLLEDGCSSNGINADLCKLGPEAFTDYDIIVAAVDNFDAKVLLNELIRQLPESRRPAVIMDGTHDEMAQSVITDFTEFCLRCLIDESWMKNSSIRTSCTGPQIRQIAGKPEIVRTTHLASSMAAHLSAEQFRGFVIGSKDVMNRRITYTAYPNLELSISHPIKKKNCPGCAVHPPEHIEWIKGCVMSTTLGDLIEQLKEKLGTDDFEISVHRLNYHKVVHSDFVVNDLCRCCGESVNVMQHSGRIFPEDLVCDSCKAEGKTMDSEVAKDQGAWLKAFTPDCSDELKGMTLFDLGYPLGAHIEVIERNGALDFLDFGKIKTTVYALDQDHEAIHYVKKL